MLEFIKMINSDYAGVLSLLSSLIMVIVTIVYVGHTKRQANYAKESVELVAKQMRIDKQRLPVFHGFAEHQLNRAILYSATILRKLIEDETEAEEIASAVGISLLKQETTHAILTATKYPYTAEEGWTVRSIFRTGDYGPGNTVSLKSKAVCNWLIHSCIWSLVQTPKGKYYSGFLVASDFDREKHIHFVSFDEWQRLIKLAIAHGVF